MKLELDKEYEPQYIIEITKPCNAWKNKVIMLVRKYKTPRRFLQRRLDHLVEEMLVDNLMLNLNKKALLEACKDTKIKVWKRIKIAFLLHDYLELWAPIDLYKLLDWDGHTLTDDIRRDVEELVSFICKKLE